MMLGVAPNRAGSWANISPLPKRAEMKPLVIDLICQGDGSPGLSDRFSSLERPEYFLLGSLEVAYSNIIPSTMCKSLIVLQLIC